MLCFNPIHPNHPIHSLLNLYGVQLTIDLQLGGHLHIYAIHLGRIAAGNN